jgi:hypothetical protein
MKMASEIPHSDARTTTKAAPEKPVPFFKRFVWVSLAWACWGGFIGVCVLMAGELQGLTGALAFAAGGLILGMLTFPVRRILRMRDETVAHFLAGAAVGGLFCAIAGGLLLYQTAPGGESSGRFGCSSAPDSGWLPLCRVLCAASSSR